MCLGRQPHPCPGLALQNLLSNFNTNNQNTATPTSGDPTDAVLGVSIFSLSDTSKIPTAAIGVTKQPIMCMANIAKAAQFKYYADDLTPSASSNYIAGKQPINATMHTVPVYSGTWTHLYTNAVHGTGSDTVLWIATRAVGGSGCEALAPTNISTCTSAIWYAQIRVIEADTIFSAMVVNEDVIFHSLMSLYFPTISVSSNGSAIVHFSYSSDYIDPGIIADNGDLVNLYPGVASYGINIDLGPTSYMWIKAEGQSTVQVSPELGPELTPVAFGRYSSSDTVQLPDGKRVMYSAVTYAFNTPDWTSTGDIHLERGINNVANYIAVTYDNFR